MTGEERTTRMGTDNIWKLSLVMALPAIIGNISSALYNIIARYFVGNYVSKNALGALALLFPLNNLTSALSLIATIGGAALVSLSLGQKDTVNAHRYFTNILAYTAISGAVLAILYGFFAPQLVNICGAGNSSGLFEPAVTYLRITAVGQLFLLFNLSLAGVIRAEGNTIYSMVSCIIGAVINTVCCWGFIAVIHRGIEGAAYATLIGQFVSAIVSLSYFIAGKSSMQFLGIKEITGQRIVKIMVTGMASSILSGLSAIINIIINHQLMIYGKITLGNGGGDLAISAVSVINTVETLMIMTIMGINQGVSPIISYNYGYEQYKRVRTATLSGQTIAAVITVFLWLIAMLYPEVLFSIFSNHDKELINYGITAIHKSKMFLLFLGFQTLASLYFSSIGKPQTATCISIIRSILFVIPFLFIFPIFWGLDGVLYATSASDLCSTLVVAIIYIFGLRQLSQQTKRRGIL